MTQPPKPQPSATTTKAEESPLFNQLEALRKIAPVVLPDRSHDTLLMARRQALIIELGAIEDYLGMDRSITPKRKRAA